MGYNTLDTTNGEANNDLGPYIYFPTPLEEDLTEADAADLFASKGGIRIGVGSPDGFKNGQSASEDTQYAHGNLPVRKLASEFTDTSTANLWSFKDADVKRFLYGDENVEVSGGKVKTKRRGRQGRICGFAFLGKDVDGGDIWIIHNKAQVSVNLENEFTDGDLINYEVEIEGLADFEGKTSYEIVDESGAY